jgi:serine phosphatase RsbU (regulator of sigma subunit)
VGGFLPCPQISGNGTTAIRLVIIGEVSRGMPLGLMPGMSYEEKETQLGAGEAALFYSDGLVEAHNPQREMFGFPRLQVLVAKHGDEEGALGDLLMEELYSFVGEGWEQEDDITLVTLRCSAPLS